MDERERTASEPSETPEVAGKADEESPDVEAHRFGINKPESDSEDKPGRAAT